MRLQGRLGSPSPAKLTIMEESCCGREGAGADMKKKELPMRILSSMLVSRAGTPPIHSRKMSVFQLRFPLSGDWPGRPYPESESCN